MNQDEGGRQPEYLSWSGEPEVPDILEQGSDRPPIRWRLPVRWQRPPMVAIVLGVAGLLVGLAAGYSAGILHAGKATAASARPSAAASPTTFSPLVISGPPGQIRVVCFAQVNGGSTPQPLPTAVVTFESPAQHGLVLSLPPAGQTCHQ